MVVFPDVASSALDGLLHESEFDARAVTELLSDADEGAVLIEDVALYVAAKVDENFVPQGHVGAFRFGERDRCAEEISEAVFVAPVADVPVSIQLGHFTDPSLL